MLFVFLSQKYGLIVVAALPTHNNSRLNIEATAGLDERLKLLSVLQLRITIQKKGRMIDGRLMVFMKLFKVLDEIVYSLGIQELYKYVKASVDQYSHKTNLTYDLRWFCIVDSFQVLLHRGVIVPFLIKEISVFAKDDVPLVSVHASFLRETDR